MSVIRNQLRDYLSRLGINKTIYIAFSGGIDSTVLLHAAKILCSETQHALKAIHINHQIHADSLLWSQHCENQCRLLNVEFKNITVDIKRFGQHGTEGSAREARYQAFKHFLTDNDILLTAHHSDDQMETVLLQLFRGAGVHGLAACARERMLGDAVLIRPFLDVSRAQIENYAKQEKLTWLEDPSNQSLIHDRNYLRHKIMPLLHMRWHNLQDIAGRVAQWQNEAATLLDDMADTDLELALDEQGRLKISHIESLDYLRKKNLLRRWIRRRQCHVPSSDILARIVNEVMHSREDAKACVQWQHNEIRKFRDKLYLLSDVSKHDSSQSYLWNLNEQLDLPSLNTTLTYRALKEYGVSLDNIDQLTVRFRQGGEVMRPRGRGCQKDLKALFQESGVEPWQRERIPLLYHGDQLIFVWGYWVQEGY